MQLSAWITLINAAWYIGGFTVSGIIFLIIRHFAYKHAESEKALMQKREKFFVFRMEAPTCYRIFGTILTAFSFGWVYPFYFIDSVRLGFKEFRFNGTSAEFTGSAKEYCLSVFCLNYFLSIVTFGMWEFCGCASKRANTWLDNHVSLPDGKPSIFYYFRAKIGLIDKILCYLTVCLSCGITRTYFFLLHSRIVAAQYSVGQDRSILLAEYSTFCTEASLPGCLYTFLSCGCYACCGCYEERVNTYLDRKMVHPNECINTETTKLVPHGEIPAMESNDAEIQIDNFASHVSLISLDKTNE